MERSCQIDRYLKYLFLRVIINVTIFNQSYYFYL
jgi:hypothetical protein